VTTAGRQDRPHHRASSGIGEATARHLARRAPRRAGARRVERLAALVEELKTAGHSAEYAEWT